jgi:hypothetical protein
VAAGSAPVQAHALSLDFAQGEENDDCGWV